MSPLILAIDQGTTSTRAMVFDRAGAPRAVAQQEFTQHYPRDGWVEHDAEEIWKTTLGVCREALKKVDAEKAGDVACIGITNQRETAVIWDRRSGKPIHRAIVWQDRRTADVCRELKESGAESEVTAGTGLLLDPYFSATKIAWILDHVDGARDAAESGRLAFGTTDCFLLWRLTGGRVHATDATNASRTLLFNIHQQKWDDALLDRFRVPRALMPEVKDSAGAYGECDGALLGKTIRITGIAGDQQAAAIGQACFSPGMIKSTYGTGCFVLLNTGEVAVASNNRMLTTVAYRIDGRVSYALEGSIFIAGAAVQWLRDGLGMIESASETESLAASLESNRGVYLVPAFTGLGAPYWNPDARGALFGLTRDSGRAELARAALESVCYQTLDLVDAMRSDSGGALETLRVDGGMVVNNWAMQFLADVTGLSVDRPRVTETTALGAAYLAGLGAGIFSSLEDISDGWRLERRFTPEIAAEVRKVLVDGWHRAVNKVMHDP
ncbi:MAG TPA: glycerol kinase GlpK [Gammaproteobacteria bacterium]|nr:glycerol kinase GlpK [Gammaproteobacteria bacterium]